MPSEGERDADDELIVIGEDQGSLSKEDRDDLLEQRRAYLILVRSIERRLGLIKKCPHCKRPLDKYANA